MSEEQERYDPGHTLHLETKAAENLRAQFADLMDGDESFAADVIEGQTELASAISRAIEQVANDLANIKGLDEYIKAAEARKSRIAKRVETMKAAISVAIELSGRRSWEHPLAKLSMAKTPRQLVITDESAIPSSYFVAKEPTLSHALVTRALKDGREVPGAALNNGGETLKWYFS